MNKLEAINTAVKNGTKIKHKHWEPEHAIYYDKHLKRFTWLDGKYFSQFSADLFLQDDWEVYHEPITEEEIRASKNFLKYGAAETKYLKSYLEKSLRLLGNK